MTHIAAALLAVARGPYRQGFAYQHARSEACRSSLSAPPQAFLSGLSSVPGVTLSCSVARPAFCDLCVHRVLVCDLVCLRRVLKLQSFTTSRHDTKTSCRSVRGTHAPRVPDLSPFPRVGEARVGKENELGLGRPRGCTCAGTRCARQPCDQWATTVSGLSASSVPHRRRRRTKDRS